MAAATRRMARESKETPKGVGATPDPQCCPGLRGRIHRRVADAHLGDGFFPLPAVGASAPKEKQVCRSVAQRLARRDVLDQRVDESIRAANSAAGYDTPVVSSKDALSPVALAAHSRLRRLHATTTPVGVSESAQEACNARLTLRGRRVRQCGRTHANWSPGRSAGMCPSRSARG